MKPPLADSLRLYRRLPEVLALRLKLRYVIISEA
jgi:hypothetical protein